MQFIDQLRAVHTESVLNLDEGCVDRRPARKVAATGFGHLHPEVGESPLRRRRQDLHLLSKHSDPPIIDVC